MNTANRSPGYALKKRLHESKVEFPVEVIIISAFTWCAELSKVQRRILNVIAYHAPFSPQHITPLSAPATSNMTVGSQGSLSSVTKSRELYMKKYNTNTHGSPVDFVTNECQLTEKSPSQASVRWGL